MFFIRTYFVISLLIFGVIYMKRKSFFSFFIFSFFICSVILYHHYGTIATSALKRNTIIVIDVGHGGYDPGKVSLNGIKEKDINLQISQHLKEELSSYGYTVFLTREDDIGLCDENVSNKKRSDLNNRIQFFKQHNADLAISIHQNSYTDAASHGAQTFYFSNSEQGKLLAQSIQKSLLSIDSTNKRSEKASDSYYLLKHSDIPSVIVECGFLSNPTETANLTDSNYQKSIAHAISEGIYQYLTSISSISN